MKHFLAFLIGLVFAGCHARADEFAFTHPGLLHSRAALARIKAGVVAKQEPFFSGNEEFRTHPASQ